MNSKYLIAAVAVIAMCALAIASSAMLHPNASTLQTTNTTTPQPSTSPTATPTISPTVSPTHSPTPTPTPTVSPTTAPTPTPTPSPENTTVQNVTLSYVQDENGTVTSWTINGTLTDAITNETLTDQTITIVDATDNSIIYGTATTDSSGYFQVTFQADQLTTIQIIFAGNTQYASYTSDQIQLAVPV